MTIRSLAVTLALVTGSLSLAPPVLAETTPGAPASAQDIALAEAAFNEGVKLAQEGKWQEAIVKFELSMKLDPASGTARNLGKCYEEVGRTASAYGAYSQAAGLARVKVNDDIRAAAEERIAALGPALSRIQFHPPKQGAPPKGLSVAVDGKPIPSDALTVAVPVDPGTRRIEVTAPGKVPWTTSVSISPKPGTMTIELPTLPDVLTTGKDNGMPLGAKIAAISLAGAGAVALGVGIGFGVDSLDKNAASKKLCDPADETRCSASGAVLRNQAFASATASNVGIGLGVGALAAAGGVLLVSHLLLNKPSPGGDAAITAIGVGPGGVAVHGRF